jgi:hypothetical protein
MPKQLAARPLLDAIEERHVRKLAHSAHAAADWIVHAKLIVRRWEGLRTRQLASQLACHPETVRTRLHAFNEQGSLGWGCVPVLGASRGSRSWSAARSSPGSNCPPPARRPMNGRGSWQHLIHRRNPSGRSLR